MVDWVTISAALSNQLITINHENLYMMCALTLGKPQHPCGGQPGLHTVHMNRGHGGEEVSQSWRAIMGQHVVQVGVDLWTGVG